MRNITFDYQGKVMIVNEAVKVIENIIDPHL